jgi:carbamoyl-phosphate synthase large subunit
MRIMVLGAGGPAADNYIKSLRLADPSIYVLGVDTHPLMLELSCASETVCIDTRPSDHDAHWESIHNLVDDHDITMIHAQPDQEALFLADQVWTIDNRLSLPNAKVIAACQDKLECAKLLGDLAPKSAGIWIDGYEEPLWVRARSGAGSLAAKRVDSIQEACDWKNVWRGRVAFDDFMTSEYLPGEDRSYTGVWWRGEPVASACRVRVEYADTRTPSGQCSSPRIAKLDSRPETFDVAEAAIRRVSDATGTAPHGVFYVDMREAADGRLLVTEINAGRFNTTQNFYAEAGANLPYVHAVMHHAYTESDFASNHRLQVDDADLYWVRQPDMGHKLVVKQSSTDYLYRGAAARSSA